MCGCMCVGECACTRMRTDVLYGNTGCWTQQDIYYTTLEIVPREDTGIDLKCLRH